MAVLTQFTIRKGNHFCWPRVFKMRQDTRQICWKAIFADTCNYNLGNEDQEDWNKLLGIFYNLLDPHDNTVMVGWRYNPKTNLIELNAYFHLNKERFFTDTLMTIGFMQDLYVTFNIDYKQQTYQVVLESPNTGSRAEYTQAFKHNRTRNWEINFYFGGNQPAPQTISVWKGQIDPSEIKTGL